MTRDLELEKKNSSQKNNDKVSFNYKSSKLIINGTLVEVTQQEPILSVYYKLKKANLSLTEIANILFKHKEGQVRQKMYSQNFYTEQGSEAETNVINNDKEATYCILWCINHYTGLNRNKNVIEAGIEASKAYGTGSGTSALSCGHSSLHKQVEEKISTFIGKETCLFFPTGYSTNVGALSALCTADDLIIFDRECHASIIDGVKLSGATYYSFKHNNVKNLEKKLKLFKGKYKNIFVLVESSYSMSGDLCPLSEIAALKEEYPFYLYVDEAHTFGFYGTKGAGFCESLNLTDKVDFIMSTLSKATASLGGFIACDEIYRPLLEWKANAYIFQAACSPFDAAVVLKSLEVIETTPGIQESIHNNNNYMRVLLNKAGFDLGESKSPVIPIRIPNDQLLQKISIELYKHHIFTVSVIYPAVKNGQGLLRFIVTANHTKEQIDYTVSTLSKLCKQYQVIPEAIIGR